MSISYPYHTHIYTKGLKNFISANQNEIVINVFFSLANRVTIVENVLLFKG